MEEKRQSLTENIPRAIRGSYAISEGIRRALLGKSSGDRMFFDNLVLLVWCEYREGNTCKSRSWEEWADIELPCYSSGQGAAVDKETGMCFNTPRRKLSRRELDEVQMFIGTHTFRNLTDAKRQMSSDLFNDCICTALNCLNARRPFAAHGAGKRP